MRRSKVFLVLAILGCVAPTGAVASVSALADGAPWTASMDNGRTMKMTLNPDGSGRMTFGVMSRKISWTEEDSKLCLSGMPRADGPRCLSTEPIPGGYKLLMENGQSISLSR